MTQKNDLYFDEKAWGQMAKVVEVLLKSGAMPKGIQNGHQAMMITQAGREMGMKPMEALNSLYIVNGSVNLWGKSLISRFRLFGYRIKFTNETADSVTAEVTKGDEKYVDTFTFEEAEQSGWTKDRNGNLKAGWYKGANRKRKLRYGVLSLIAHTYLPEILGSAAGVVEISQDYLEGADELDLPVPEHIKDKKVKQFEEEIKQKETVKDEEQKHNEALKKAQEAIKAKREKLSKEK